MYYENQLHNEYANQHLLQVIECSSIPKGKHCVKNTINDYVGIRKYNEQNSMH